MNEIDLDPEVEEQAMLLEEELKKIPLKKVNMEAHTYKRTICQVLRDIYNKTENEDVKQLCIEATVKAKKITRKFIEYKLKEEEWNKK